VMLNQGLLGKIRVCYMKLHYDRLYEVRLDSVSWIRLDQVGID